MESGFKFRWSLVAWEVPNDTKEAQADYRRWRRVIRKWASPTLAIANILRPHGLCMVMRAPAYIEQELLPHLPADGRLQIIGITDKQVERSIARWGKTRAGATA